MQRINTTNKETDLFGAGKHGYRAGNPATGQSATELSFTAMNALQEELAHVIEASGAVLDPADNTQLYTRILAIVAASATPPTDNRKLRQPGELFTHAGTAAPAGSLVCPVAQTTVSRTTYAALFAAIGTTWGAGDGATTFGLPWLPAGYALLQANGNVGTPTVGAVIAHTHSLPIIPSTFIYSNSSGSNQANAGAGVTGSTGGTANLAAGASVLICVQYI